MVLMHLNHNIIMMLRTLMLELHIKTYILVKQNTLMKTVMTDGIEWQKLKE